MPELSATIKNTQGIHCRPSAVIVKEIQKYDGEIMVSGDSGECDPRSIMALMSLGLQCGAKVGSPCPAGTRRTYAGSWSNYSNESTTSRRVKKANPCPSTRTFRARIRTTVLPGRTCVDRGIST